MIYVTANSLRDYVSRTLAQRWLLRNGVDPDRVGTVVVLTDRVGPVLAVLVEYRLKNGKHYRDPLTYDLPATRRRTVWLDRGPPTRVRRAAFANLWLRPDANPLQEFRDWVRCGRLLPEATRA